MTDAGNPGRISDPAASPTQRAPDRLSPMALSLEEAARLLGVRREVLEEDIRAGAPTNANGTLNLISYAAWLNLQLQEDEDPPSPKAMEDNSAGA